MDQNLIYQLDTIVVAPDGRREPGEAEAASEHVLDVLVNERPAYRMACTKSFLKELVAGRLKTDGLIRDSSDIYQIILCRQEREVSVFLNHEVSWEDAPAMEPSCCTGNRTYGRAGGEGWKKLPHAVYQPDWIFGLAEEFRKGTELHDRTGGVHLCMLAREGRVVFKAEDIGRHNALDKAVGHALLNGIPLGECMLFTSGRVPEDMVEKVIAAGVPVLVSKSVPTKESVELAGEYGLELICRVWPDRFEIFNEAGDGMR